jgi:CheY-like chemotaxis protein
MLFPLFGNFTPKVSASKDKSRGYANAPLHNSESKKTDKRKDSNTLWSLPNREASSPSGTDAQQGKKTKSPVIAPVVDSDKQMENDDPDLPKGSSGIDKETYLRLREEYILMRRGFEPYQPFDARARSRAIEQMEKQEEIVREPLFHSDSFRGTMPHAQVRAQSMNFLIVEDNENMRCVIRSVISDFADEVYECADGAEALASYAEHRPDWVLMDLRMRNVDGITATNQITSAFADARVLIVTDYDDQDLRQASSEAGACGYVVKENLLDLSQMLRAHMPTKAS